MSTAASGDRLTGSTKFLYGMGDTGFSLASTIIGVYSALATVYLLGRQKHLEIRQELAKRRSAMDGERANG